MAEPGSSEQLLLMADIEAGEDAEAESLNAGEFDLGAHDSEYYDSDEDFDMFGEEDQDEEEHMLVKGLQRSDDYQWVDELAAVKDPAISEAMLHTVPWHEVAWETLGNVIVTGVFFVAHAAMGLSAFVELPLFIMSMLLLTVASELIAEGGAGTKYVCGIISLLFPSTGAVALKLDIGSPDVLMHDLPKLFTLGLVVLSICVTLCNLGRLHKSTCYQALSGIKVLRLTRRLDLVKLAKAMHFIKKKDMRAKSCGLQWLVDLVTCKRYSNHQIVLGSVKVDPDPTVPDVALRIGGVEVEDSEFRLVSVVAEGDSDNPLPIKDLQTILKRKAEITHKILTSWLPGISVPQDTELDLLPKAHTTEQTNVRDWFFTRRLAPAQQSVCMQVKIQRFNYTAGALEHWIVRALLLTCIIDVLSLPARMFLSELVHIHEESCRGETTHIELSSRHVLCSNAERCNQLCANILTFVEEFNEVLHTSYVEYLIVFILLPVFILVFSATYVSSTRSKVEQSYFSRLPYGKKAIREVVEGKKAFERMLRTQELFARFKARFQAWNPFDVGDPELVACTTVTESTTTVSIKVAAENPALEYAVKDLTAMKSTQEFDCIELTFGIRCDPDDAEEKAEIERAWLHLATRNNLGGKSNRNFKVVLDVSVGNEEVWKMWKQWFDEVYKNQMEVILDPKTGDAQDGGHGTHLLKSAVVGDQGIPKGFSLTHILTTNPEDGSVFQIDLDSEMDHRKKFDNELKTMEKMLTAQTEYESGPVTLEDRLSGDCPIILRFTLSEQYWSRMSSNYKSELAELLDGSELIEKTFSEFVGKMLAPLPEKSHESAQDDGSTTSSLGVVIGDADPFTAMLSSGKVLLGRAGVFTLSLLCMLIVPCWRRFVEGGLLFPTPFVFTFLFNLLGSTVVMSFFLLNFSNVTERLGFIANCLAEFEQKTINPSAKSAKKSNAAGSSPQVPKNPTAGEGGAPTEGVITDGTTATGNPTEGTTEAASDPNTSNKKGSDRDGVEGSTPFDLTISEEHGVLYEPHNPWWKKEWKKKQDNLKNWHHCASHLRVFVTSSRLTAQTVLIAAAFILAFMLVFSLIQTLQGKGAVGVDHALWREAARSATSHVRDAADSVLVQAKERLGDARRLSVVLSASAATGLNQGAASNDSLLQAATDLRDMLKPFATAVNSAAEEHHDHLSRMHRRLREDSDENGGGALEPLENLDLAVSKITKTQLLTIAIVLLLIAYSVPLLWYIANINDAFDRHGNLLLATKEQHRLNQARREAAACDNEDKDEDDEDVEPSRQTDSRTPNTDVQPHMEAKDIACKRYERMLDMTIESALQNKTRFPLRLFGFVINTGLLTGWIVLASSPLLQQAQGIAPSVAMQGCQWVEKSHLMKQINDQANSATAMANSISNKAVGEKIVPKVHASKLVHDLFCVPLKKMLTSQIRKTRRKLEDYGTGRRLQLQNEAFMEKFALEARPLPRVAPLVEQWWARYPGDPWAKATILSMTLDELEREAQRSLRTVPAAVGAAMAKDAPRAALAVARSYLDVAGITTAPSRAVSEL